MCYVDEQEREHESLERSFCIWYSLCIMFLLLQLECLAWIGRNSQIFFIILMRTNHKTVLTISTIVQACKNHFSHTTFFFEMKQNKNVHMLATYDRTHTNKIGSKNYYVIARWWEFMWLFITKTGPKKKRTQVIWLSIECVVMSRDFPIKNDPVQCEPKAQMLHMK